MFRAFALAFTVVGSFFLLRPVVAAQQAVQRVLDLNRQGMEAYTNLNVDEAKRKLMEAADVVQRSHLGGAVAARTYLNLGVISVGGTRETAKGLEYFSQALAYDPAIELDPFTSTPEIKQVFQQARSRLRGASGARQETGSARSREPSSSRTAPPANEPQLPTVPHSPAMEQLADTPVPVYVETPVNVSVANMHLYYRSTGMREYRRVEMVRMENGFGFEIPCTDVFPPRVEYYVLVYGAGGQAVGTVGSPDSPIGVPIVSARTTAAPALPGKAPPERCSFEECPPGMPGCITREALTGGASAYHRSCEESVDCPDGWSCSDEGECVQSDTPEEENEEEGGARHPSESVKPIRVFLDLGGSIGAGYATSGKAADSPPSSSVAADNAAWIPSGSDKCRLSNPEAYCVRVATPGLVPTYAVRAALGVYLLPRLAVAAMFRYQPSAGQGTLSHFLIGGRVQYLFTDPVTLGFNASALLGFSIGQIQVKPDQNSSHEPYIISGLQSVHVGAILGWRFARYFGLILTPEFQFLFPDFLFHMDLTAGVQVSY